jgi:hypothetical protein
MFPLEHTTLVTASALGAAFSSFKQTAFRLELRQQFDVEEERIPFEQYQSGIVPDQTPDFLEWCNEISIQTKTGRQFLRVRFLQLPLTTYSKFEIEFGYSRTVPAGERVSVITGSSLPRFKTEVPMLKDFWLFDSSSGFLMDYDERGQFMGALNIPAAWIPNYVALATEAHALSVQISSTEFWPKGT